jgi:hypothetical protein
MIHSLWTEKQLEMKYSDAATIKGHPEIQAFIAWVKKKDPLFYIKTKDSNSRKAKRKGK